jgi:hypothetical protein
MRDWWLWLRVYVATFSAGPGYARVCAGDAVRHRRERRAASR